MIVLVGSVSLSLWAFRETPRGLVSHGVPLAGDGILIGTLIRIVRDESYANLLTGLQSYQYGWPGFLDFRYWPLGILLELTALKALSGISGIQDPSVLLHIFSVLKSVPIALASYFFYRKLSPSRGVSAILAIAFGLVSFNLIRAEGHFVLGFTWSIPLVLGICVSIWRIGDPSENVAPSRVSLGHFFAGLACGLSAFYFAVFNGLLAGIVTVLVFVRQARISFGVNKRVRYSRLSSHLRIFCLPVGIVTGLLTQLWPTILQGRLRPAVSPVVSRSWIEPVIYSGSVESFFYDTHALISRLLRRQDVVAFLDARTVWEGRQVGAVVGVIVYLMAAAVVLLVVFRFLLSRPLLEFSLSTDARWLAAFLGITTLLYFSSAINFVFSRTLLTTIRAWGRLSPYFMLLLVGFCLAVISKSRHKRLLTVTLVLLVVIVQSLEVREFRSSRPPAAVLASLYSEDRNRFLETLEDIQLTLPSRCGIAQLPIYPFPEFDRPDDSNIDYAHFQLPIHDPGIYKWSYGAIKNTVEADVYLPLTLQTPPFSRAGLRAQVNAYRESAPCGFIIDSSLLTPSELSELEKLLVVMPRVCLRELEGANFKSEPRYFLLLQDSAQCKLPFTDADYVQVEGAVSQSFLWQYESVEVNQWLSNMPLTRISNPIRVAYSNPEDSNLVAVVRLLASRVLELNRNTKTQFCYAQINSETCTEIDMHSTRPQVVRLVGLEKETGKVVFTIRSGIPQGERFWSVLMGTAASVTDNGRAD